MVASVGSSGRSAGVTPVSAFVSWAHDVAAWEQTIAAFTLTLRDLGIDADVDLFHLDDADVNWSTYGPRSIVDSNFVLIAASPAYRERWEGRNDPRIGAGAAREANTLKSLFDDDQKAFREKVKVVVLPGSSTADIPTELRAAVQHFRITTIDIVGLEDLLRNLTGQPRLPLPPIGDVPLLPPILLRGLMDAGGDAGAAGPSDLQSLRGTIESLDGDLASCSLQAGAREQITSKRATMKAALSAMVASERRREEAGCSAPHPRPPESATSAESDGVLRLLRDRLLRRAAEQLDPTVSTYGTMEAVEATCRELASQIAADGFCPELIVAWRSDDRTYPGSEIVATLLARDLSAPVHTVNMKEMGEKRIVSSACDWAVGVSSALLVDDACYSGSTLLTLAAAARNTSPNIDVRPAVLTAMTPPALPSLYHVGTHATEELFFPWGWSRLIISFYDVFRLFGINDRRLVIQRQAAWGTAATIADRFTGAIGLLSINPQATCLHEADHDQDTFLYVLTGAITMQIGPKQRELEPGEYIFVPREIGYSLTARSPTLVLQLRSPTS